MFEGGRKQQRDECSYGRQLGLSKCAASCQQLGTAVSQSTSPERCGWGRGEGSEYFHSPVSLNKRAQDMMDRADSSKVFTWPMGTPSCWSIAGV